MYICGLYVIQEIEIRNHIWNWNWYMGDFPQPQQKYAGTGENGIIASAAIFYSGIKTLWNCCAPNLGV